MGVFNALTIGASGLTSFGEAVRVVGDNISNVNTLGFKAQTINFADVLGQTVNVSRSNIANQVGNGVRIGAITRNLAQGSVEGTTSATDMAISGNGLFVLKDPSTGDTQYTRAGSFFLDKDSNLINGQSLQLQGFSLDTSGNAVGNITNITVANIAATASATTKVTAGVNLNASATAVDPAVTVFDPTNAKSFTFKSDVNVFDALGTKHNVSVYFVKIAPDASSNTVWDWHAVVDGADVTGGTAGTSVEISPTVFNVANKAVAANALTGITAANTSLVIAPTTKADVNVTFKSTTTTGNTKIFDEAGTSYSVPTTGATWTTAQTFSQFAAANGLSTTGPYHIVTATAAGTQTLFNVTAGNISTGSSTVASSVATAGKQALTFNQSTGALKAAVTPAISFTWTSAAASSLAFDFGTSTTAGGTGLDGTIQLAGASATRFMNADGFASGFLDRLETDSAGKINGVFTNGQRRALFQVGLAKFPNEAVLNKLGNNMLAETIASGTPVIGKPNNGGLGSIQPFALEKSNVDLANEFVKLIVIQRAYEANSKTILTTDQMLSALMTLKR